MALGGVFYYNIFKWTFDERLKQEVLELVRMKSPDMLSGLLKNPQAITLDEMDVMNWLSKDERMVSVVYLAGNGTVRWHREGRFIDMPYDEFTKNVGLPTDAIARALMEKGPVVRLVPKEPFYDIAIPVHIKDGTVLGVLNLLVSRVGVKKLISSAMVKYVYGAVMVLFIIGAVMYFFMYYFVISKLTALNESVESVSLKSLEFKYPPRNDEIGDVAVSVSALVDKVRAELVSLSERERQYKSYEQSWWEGILRAVVARESRALVVDEDNNILLSNFDIPRKDPAQKLHLLDVIDSQQVEVLRLIGTAIDSPQQLMEGEAVFKGQLCHARVIQLQDASGAMRRTLIVFDPKKK
jgi:HAMP domain-containing protein